MLVTKKAMGVIGLSLLSLIPTFVVHADSPLLVVNETIQDCISERKNLDVLMLVDESKSLKTSESGIGNDPHDSRVPALKSVVRLLASTVGSIDSTTTSSQTSVPLKVSIAISGFGAGYTAHLPFTELTKKGVDTVLETIDGQGEKDNDIYTRYHVGLRGALSTFVEHAPQAKQACRLLLWFSDGVHDDDNKRGFSDVEELQIKEEVCGGDGNGIVDGLRAEGVYIVAAGLNPVESELGLMRLIAQGGQPFNPQVPTGRKSMSVQTCGVAAPNGKFQIASNADEIFEKIIQVLSDVPGVPKDPVSLPLCNGSTISCNEMRFIANESISSFTILATRPNNATEIHFVTNDGTNIIALQGIEGSVALGFSVTEFTKISDTKVLITVTRKVNVNLAGQWAVQFIGKGSEKALGSVNFIGQAEIVLKSGGSSNSKGLKVDRLAPETLEFSINAGSNTPYIRDADVTISDSLKIRKLRAVFMGSDSFEVTSDEVGAVLNNSEFKNSNSVRLRIYPIGFVENLKTLSGEPIQVSFNSKTFSISISNGKNFPVFRGVKEESLVFKGVITKQITLLFDGPDGGDGQVAIESLVEPSGSKAKFELVKSQTCDIKQKSGASECVIEVVQKKAAYGNYDIGLNTTFRPSSAGVKLGEQAKADQLTISVKSLVPTDKGRGILAALILILLLLVVQGLVRFFLSLLLSKFAPLSPTARRIRLNVNVDSDGVLTVSQSNDVAPDDDGFVLENVESVSMFSIFRYEFNCSVLQTFLHSTSTPVGIVSCDSTVVIGTRGHQISKDDPYSEVGLVDLTLRNQWLVGIKSVDIQSLLARTGSVDAEIVAFLDPYEVKDRASQIQDLYFTITSSSFAPNFVKVLERFKTDEVEGDPPIAPDIDDPFVDKPAVPVFDAFGDAVSSASASSNVEDKSAKKKKRKKNEKSSKTVVEEDDIVPRPPPNDEWSPFA